MKNVIRFLLAVIAAIPFLLGIILQTVSIGFTAGLRKASSWVEK